jgi:hypothetical protein
MGEMGKRGTVNSSDRRWIAHHRAWRAFGCVLCSAYMACSEKVDVPLPPPLVAQALEQVLKGESKGNEVDYDERFLMVCGVAVGVLLQRNQTKVKGELVVAYIRSRLYEAGYRKQQVNWSSSRHAPRPSSVERRNLAPLVIKMMPKIDRVIALHKISEPEALFAMLDTAGSFLRDQKHRKRLESKDLDKVVPFLTKTLELAAQKAVWVSRGPDRQLINYIGPR